MSYAIMRVRKIKSYAELRNAEAHNLRTKEVEHIEKPNYVLLVGANGISNKVQELVKAVEKVQGKKVRKDCVRAIEVVMTSDKEFFQQSEERNKEWVAKNISYLEQTYGKDNVARGQIVVHTDEECLHIHAIIPPVYNDAFNAKHFLGGRQDFIKMQNNYYEAMEQFGMQRGKAKTETEAEHTKSEGYRKLKSENNKLKAENKELYNYVLKQYIRTYKKNYQKEPTALEREIFLNGIKTEVENNIKDIKNSKKVVDAFITKNLDKSI